VALAKNLLNKTSYTEGNVVTILRTILYVSTKNQAEEVTPFLLSKPKPKNVNLCMHNAGFVYVFLFYNLTCTQI